jgi:hypothetical protein
MSNENAVENGGRALRAPTQTRSQTKTAETSQVRVFLLFLLISLEYSRF